ncbi:MAG: EamA family transporter [Sandaracinus sp.]|nr:EamA family transporter [Sandaracinus sp.]
MTSRSDRWLGTALILAAASSWGTWSYWLRPTELPSEVTTPLVFLVIALGSWPLARREGTPKWSKRALALLVAFGISDAINVATFFGAMQVTTVAVAVLTHYAAPVLIALLAPTIDGVSVPRAKPAALLALAGLTVVLERLGASSKATSCSVPGSASSAPAPTRATSSWRDASRVDRLEPHARPSRALSRALVYCPSRAQASPRSRCATCPTSRSVASCPASSRASRFLRALTLVGSARASILAFVEPLVACVVGWLAFGESLSWTVLVGAALVIAAGVMVVAPSAEA